MCGLSSQLANLIIMCAIPLLFFIGFMSFMNSSLDQTGHISDFYRMNSKERFVSFLIDIPLFAILFFLTVAGFSSDISSFDLNISRQDTIAVIVSGLAIIFSFVMAKNYFSRDLIKNWLATHGYQVKQFIWSADDNPWERQSAGLFDNRESTPGCFKVEVLDANDNPRIAHILWGGTFDFAWLSGKISVELLWNKARDRKLKELGATLR